MAVGRFLFERDNVESSERKILRYDDNKKM